MGDKYSIEYSEKQKCFHIDILEKTLENKRIETFIANKLKIV